MSTLFDSADLAAIEIDPCATNRELTLVAELRRLYGDVRRLETVLRSERCDRIHFVEMDSGDAFEDARSRR